MRLYNHIEEDCYSSEEWTAMVEVEAPTYTIIEWETKKIANKGRCNEYAYWVCYKNNYTTLQHAQLTELEKKGEVRNIIIK